MRLGLIAGNGRFPFLVLDAARRARPRGHHRRRPGRGLAGPGRGRGARAAGRDRLGVARPAGPLHRDPARRRRHPRRDGRPGQARQDLLRHRARPTAARPCCCGCASKNTDALISAVADVLRRPRHRAARLDRVPRRRCWRGAGADRRGGPPTDDEQADLAFGYRMADAIAGLDIGQTIVVKDAAVVAVEAMEGHRRGDRAGRARWPAPGARVVKVAKPNQDMRFDVPVVGAADDRGDAARPARPRCRSTRAGRCCSIGPTLVAAADAAGIAIVGRARGRQPDDDVRRHRSGSPSSASATSAGTTRASCRPCPARRWSASSTSRPDRARGDRGRVRVAGRSPTSTS